MNKKQKNVKKAKFQIVDNQDNLSAGICGQEGCVIDWSKAETNKKEDK